MRRREVERGGYILRPDDRGASLIAVVVALVFVLTMAAIITEATTANIRLREFEVAEKENFYGADAVIEDLRSKMAPVAMEKMEISYREMLSVYGEVLSRYAEEGEGIQEFARIVEKEFRRIYMDNLSEYFRDPLTDESMDDVTYDGNTSGDGKKTVLFRVGNYDGDLIKDMLGDNSRYFQVSADDMKFTADYTEGFFALKNLRIVYSDPDNPGYETWITTDLVFETPAFQYDDGSTKSFMDYALIADTKIVAATSDNSAVTGSVYAGAGGIASTSGTKPVNFSGDNIVTRGDIVVNGSSVLTFGLSKEDLSGMGFGEVRFEGTTHIWARNVYVEEVSNLGSGGDAGADGGGADVVMNLVMKGDINIEDDLVLNGTNSKAKLSGSYNGYNFRENYVRKEDADEDYLSPSADSFFSSAIMINGSNCRLDLTELNHLYLAGRAFISRGSKIVGEGGNRDILLGESLSVRADQLAYLVNERFLVKDSDGKVVISGGTANFSDDGKTLYEESTGIQLSKYSNWLEVVPYQYRNQLVSTSTGQAPVTQYYLYFNNADAANDFFLEYWDAFAADTTGGERLSKYDDDYAAAVLLNDDDTILTLSGDLLYRNDPEGEENEGFVLGQFKIADSRWTPSGIYWERSDMLARTYKSLQTDLAGVYTRVSSADVRFADDGFGYPDKTEDSLFENHLIDKAALKNFLDSALSDDSTWQDISNISAPGYRAVSITGSITGEDGLAEGWEVVICENESAQYPVNNSFNGIAIATGDVNIVSKVNGLVISGGTISLGGSKVEAAGDADLVKAILDEVIQREYGSQFIAIFKDYQHFGSFDVSSTKIGDYLFYENWTKNEGVLADNGVTEP